MLSRLFVASKGYYQLLRGRPTYKFCIRDPKKVEPGESQAMKDLHEKQKMLGQREDEDKEKDEEEGASTTAYVLGAGGILLALSYVMLQMQALRGQKKGSAKNTQTVSYGKADIGGEWSLIDTKGNTFSSKDLKGQYYLMYFGFCNCPDICPNSLTKLKKAVELIKKQPESKLFKLRSVFVSVDPDRDDAEKIQKFLGYFDKQMIGVTGTHNNDPALKDCMKKFKIYASKINFEDDLEHQGRKGYTIDHTILTYLIDDENNYLTHLGSNLGEHELAKNIMDAVMSREKAKLQSYKS